MNCSNRWQLITELLSNLIGCSTLSQPNQHWNIGANVWLKVVGWKNFSGWLRPKCLPRRYVPGSSNTWAAIPCLEKLYHNKLVYAYAHWLLGAEAGFDVLLFGFNIDLEFGFLFSRVEWCKIVVHGCGCVDFYLCNMILDLDCVFALTMFFMLSLQSAEFCATLCCRDTPLIQAGLLSLQSAMPVSCWSEHSDDKNRIIQQSSICVSTFSRKFSGVTDGGTGVDLPLGKLNVKTGPRHPLALYFGFNIFWFSAGCCFFAFFLVFSSDLGF